MDRLLRFWVESFGQRIQHIGGLMHPTPLFTGLAVEDIPKRIPEPERAVTDRQGGGSQPSVFEVTQ